MSSDGPRRELAHSYHPGPDVVVPDLALLPGVARGDYPLTVELTTTYVDTADLALARAGIRLSVLTGGDDEGWLLMLPWTGRNSMVRAPLGPNPAEVPSVLRDLVQGWGRDRDLVEVARVEVARTSRDVLDGDDAVVARLVEDLATGTVDGRDQVGWRQWVLRSRQPALLEAADRLMADADIPAGDHVDELTRLLGDRLPGPEDPGALSRDAPAARVVGARLREQRGALLRADLELRRGREHGVHDARVALRRLRSALATFRPLLSPSAGELRDELGWLSRALGDSRDRAVVRERLVALADSEDELAGPVLERIRSASWTSDSDTSVAEVLGSPRYFALLGSLDEFVGSPPWTDRADRKAGRHLRRRVAKEWDRVAGRVALVADLDPGTAPDEALHEIRKAAKRLRYALETAELVWPRKPKRLRKRVRDLTELLGERQDTVVTRSALLELAAEADAAGEPTFTHGRLDRIEELHAAELEERFHRAWSAAVDQRADWP